jgi:hypothetical protein
MAFANGWILDMADYFLKRDSRAGYFLASKTSSPKQTKNSLPSQTTGSNTKSPYRDSSARVVVKKYALKRD